ncbi:MAG TPA: S41 family peptidase, partial [Blastocatellia bacterium]|nr:S41 family peptidase [Blastocatellia bacterium]
GLPERGLIIDVRGNGGGHIANGERLLQLLTPREIEPELFQFINSPLTLDICLRAPGSEDLAPWADSIAQSTLTGAVYSASFNITSKESCNNLGQRYYGPVILITDALCYSTTDMFAAGFQDNEAGKILGTSGNTGAGGANVCTHEDLRRILATDEGTPYRRLPRGSAMRIAIRRSLRAGKHAGKPLEEFGIAPDDLHLMTHRDLLENNVDLINHAGKMLSREKTHKLLVTTGRDQAGTRKVAVTTENVSRLDVYINGRPQRSLDVTSGRVEFGIPATSRKSELLIQGYDGVSLVAARRLQI